jgi:hypothetical protein
MTIPLSLICKAKIQTKQKVGLGIFFSLNSILVALSVARSVGLKYAGYKYYLWQLYWLTMTGNFGLVLAAGAAFREFYINHRHSKHSWLGTEEKTKDPINKHSNGSNGSSSGAYHKGKTFFFDSGSETTTGSSSKPLARDGLNPAYQKKDLEWNSRLSSKQSLASRETRDTDEEFDLGTAQGFFHIQRPRPIIIAPRMPRLG